MAVLGTSNITLPKNIAAGLWEKAQTGSAVAALSGQTPMQFGDTTLMTFNTRPRAEYVAEAAQKASSNVAFGTKTVTPKKVQVTLRFNEEVLWADEDYQLGILRTCADASGDALARALDLGVFHRINPLTGTAVTSITEYLSQTTNTVEVLDGTGANAPAGAEMELQTLAGLIIADGYVPNGVAFDPSYAWSLATERYADGRLKFPELGLGQNISSFKGLSTYSTTTVSGTPEAADTNIKAVMGDWSQLVWGVQRNVPVEVIKFGDPDGQGDLKRQNQFALRTEVVYGWAFMDLNAFGKVVNAVNEA